MSFNGSTGLDYEKIPDSGEKQKFQTGAQRDTPKGKGRFDLIPAYALKRVAKHYEKGAEKYGENNWRKGIPLRRFLDSAIRHCYSFLSGDRKEDHMAAAVWNLLNLIETEWMTWEGDLPRELDNMKGETNESE